MDQKTGAPEPFEDEIATARNDGPIGSYDEFEMSLQEHVPYDDPRWDVDYDITIPGLRKWRYGNGGALTTNIPLTGVTQILSDNSAEFFGYRHLVAIEMNYKAAVIVAKLLDPDCKFVECVSKSLISNT